MTPLCLIQLISEQTLQNLLPINALLPRALLHLTTQKTAHRSAHIYHAATVSGAAAPLELIRLSDMPSIEETARAVARGVDWAASKGLQPVVNFTGGTKLMSIGAYQQAAKSGVPSFYVDTQSGHFVDGATAAGLLELFAGDFSFSRIIADLSLDTMVVANGHRSVSAGRDWRSCLPAATAILENPRASEALTEALFGKNGLLPNSTEPRDPMGWLPVLSKPFPVPESLLGELVEAKVLLAGPSSETALLPTHTLSDLKALASGVSVAGFKEAYFAAIEPVQQSISFLGGSWWEVVVAEAMVRSGRFQDLRWSAKVTQQSGVPLEEDVLALDGADAVCVSCKKSSGGKARLIPHLDELTSRAKAIGGNFTRAFLAVHQFSRNEPDIRARARELRIRILTPESLGDSAAFA